MRININILSLVWLLLFLVFGCNSNTSNEKASTIVDSSEEKEVKVIEEQTQKYSQSDTVVIIERTLVTDSTDQEFYKPCLDWKLSETDIKKILALSDTINGHEFHYLYYYLPCEVQGKLGLRGQEYVFKLNSGSFIYLVGPDTSFYMGCAHQDCEKYFLEKGGEFDEEFK